MRLTIYHTTSSIFLRSIKEHGLVGVDIRQQLPNLSMAMKEMIDRLIAITQATAQTGEKKLGFVVTVKEWLIRNTRISPEWTMSMGVLM